MIRLFVNADDGGLAASTDETILACAAAGIVRCATVVANGATAREFVPRALAAGLDLGLHVNFTEGRALAGPFRTLTDAEGRFHAPKREVWRRAADGELDPAEVRAEVLAQWERLCSFGVTPNHVDGHNHVHLFPGACDFEGVFCRVPLDHVAPPHYLPALFRGWAEALRDKALHCDTFTGYHFSRMPSEEIFLRSIDPGSTSVEFMVHPGARAGSSFVSSEARAREAAVLCSPALREALARRHILPCHFGDPACA